MAGELCHDHTQEQDNPVLYESAIAQTCTLITLNFVKMPFSPKFDV